MAWVSGGKMAHLLAHSFIYCILKEVNTYGIEKCMRKGPLKAPVPKGCGQQGY